jgi:hypothetical protein
MTAPDIRWKIYIQLEWEKTAWAPSPALVHSSGGRVSLYVGQKYDAHKISLVEDGWSWDNCERCETWFSFDPGDLFNGYRSGVLWLCESCFQRYVATGAAKGIKKIPAPKIRKTRIRIRNGWITFTSPLTSSRL